MREEDIRGEGEYGRECEGKAREGKDREGKNNIKVRYAQRA